ncbi:MAG: glycosyltransferase [Duncaniella sp.]|nr:glycosyltransferase [Duncaniella sp.]
MNYLDPVLKAGRIFKRRSQRKSIVQWCMKRLWQMSPRPAADADTPQLEKISPDEGHSCLINNNIEANPIYDVQVIMPVYNTADTLVRAVESVLAQCKEVSLLLTIINDGSPDNAAEVLRRYEEMPDVEIITQPNRGFSGARNAGLAHIRARYVTFLDSDDRLAEGGLRGLLDAALRHDADIVQGGTERVTLDGSLINRVVTPELMGRGAITGFVWGKLYRSSLFQSVGFPEGYWFEDSLTDFILLPLASTIVSVPVMTYIYYVNPNGITANARHSVKILDTLWVTRRLLADRMMLGLHPTADDYDVFLRQVVQNHKRIARALGPRAAHGQWQQHRHLQRVYFHGLHSADPCLEAVGMALSKGSYILTRFLSGMV